MDDLVFIVCVVLWRFSLVRSTKSKMHKSASANGPDSQMWLQRNTEKGLTECVGNWKWLGFLILAIITTPFILNDGKKFFLSKSCRLMIGKRVDWVRIDAKNVDWRPKREDQRSKHEDWWTKHEDWWTKHEDWRKNARIEAGSWASTQSVWIEHIIELMDWQ